MLENFPTTELEIKQLTNSFDYCLRMLLDAEKSQAWPRMLACLDILERYHGTKFWPDLIGHLQRLRDDCYQQILKNSPDLVASTAHITDIREFYRRKIIIDPSTKPLSPADVEFIEYLEPERPLLMTKKEFDTKLLGIYNRLDPDCQKEPFFTWTYDGKIIDEKNAEKYSRTIITTDRDNPFTLITSGMCRNKDPFNIKNCQDIKFYGLKIQKGPRTIIVFLNTDRLQAENHPLKPIDYFKLTQEIHQNVVIQHRLTGDIDQIIAWLKNSSYAKKETTDGVPFLEFRYPPTKEEID